MTEQRRRERKRERNFEPAKWGNLQICFAEGISRVRKDYSNATGGIVQCWCAGGLSCNCATKNFGGLSRAKIRRAGAKFGMEQN